MTLQQILNGESKNIEFKAEIPQKSEKYIKTVIAFANGSGGTLLFGVEDRNRKILGVDENHVFEMMDSIANAISDCCQPQIIPDISLQRVEERCLIAVRIYPGSNRPYFIKSIGKENGTYIRAGATSRQADSMKIRELELEGAHISWDELVCMEYEVTDERISRLCRDIERYMVQSARTDEEKKTVHKVTVENLLNWKVLRRVEDRLLPTNAFALLTGEHFRFSKIQCALFKGTDRDVFIDKKEFSGPLYEQIEAAYQFVLRHINRGAEIEGLLRQDAYELPVGAIREMIVNAVCHRNYLDNACVQVAVYDNRVEVTSPGMLYDGLTLEEALNGRSKIRNRAIAEVLSKMDLIEAWGTGLMRIIKRAQEFHLPDPDFLEMGDTFRVNLYRKRKQSADIKDEEKTGNVGERASIKNGNKCGDEPIKADNNLKNRPIKADNNNIDSKESIKADGLKADYILFDENTQRMCLIEGTSSTNRDRMKRIMAYALKLGCIRNREARDLLGLAESTTKRLMKQMVEAGLLRAEGQRKARVYYPVTEAVHLRESVE